MRNLAMGSIVRGESRCDDRLRLARDASRRLLVASVQEMGAR